MSVIGCGTVLQIVYEFVLVISVQHQIITGQKGHVLLAHNLNYEPPNCR